MTARRKTIRVAIIVDPYGSVAMNQTGEDEIAEHKTRLTALLQPHRLIFTTPSYVSDTLTADLVVFDFGGMSPGNDLMSSNSRRLIRWMQDHPSALVIVASKFTYAHGLMPELTELGLIDEGARYSSFAEDPPAPVKLLPNMVVWQGYETERQAIKEIRAWYR